MPQQNRRPGQEGAKLSHRQVITIARLRSSFILSYLKDHPTPSVSCRRWLLSRGRLYRSGSRAAYPHHPAATKSRTAAMRVPLMRRGYGIAVVGLHFSRSGFLQVAGKMSVHDHAVRSLFACAGAT